MSAIQQLIIMAFVDWQAPDCTSEDDEGDTIEWQDLMDEWLDEIALVWTVWL